MIFKPIILPMKKREESENILELKGKCPDKRIPKGILSSGGSAIKDTLELFKTA